MVKDQAGLMLEIITRGNMSMKKVTMVSTMCSAGHDERPAFLFGADEETCRQQSHHRKDGSDAGVDANLGAVTSV